MGIWKAISPRNLSSVHKVSSWEAQEETLVFPGSQHPAS